MAGFGRNVSSDSDQLMTFLYIDPNGATLGPTPYARPSASWTACSPTAASLDSLRMGFQSSFDARSTMVSAMRFKCSGASMLHTSAMEP